MSAERYIFTIDCCNIINDFFPYKYTKDRNGDHSNGR